MASIVDFDNFYQSARDRLVVALAATVGDVELAAESVDEAMARAFARWSRLSAHPEPAGWVYVTARNLARRSEKRRSRRPPSSRQTQVEAPAGETWLVVADLPPRQREAVVLRHLAGLTEEAVGDAMGITRGTVSSTLRDAYRTLNRALSAELVEEQS